MTPVVEKLGSAVDDWVAKNHAQLVSTRRHLHAHPELAFAEFETTSYLEQRLREVRAQAAAAAHRHRAGLRGRLRGPGRRPARRHRRPAAGRPEGRAVRLHQGRPLPRLRARRAHDRRPGRRHGAGLARRAARPGAVHLPAGGGDPARRRHRGGRLRRPGRRDAGVRPALRPVGAGREDRPAHRRRSPPPATASTSRCSAPAGTPPGRSSPSTSSTPSAG